MSPAKKLPLQKLLCTGRQKGNESGGGPKITWQRTVEKEIKEMGKTWEGIKFMAKDRQMWREHVAALRAS